MGLTPTEKREILVAYLKLKVQEGDWHGVSDAACDLRELEAKHPQTREADRNA